MTLLFYSWLIKLLINGHKMGHLAMFDWLECICECICVLGVCLFGEEFGGREEEGK